MPKKNRWTQIEEEIEPNSSKLRKSEKPEATPDEMPEEEQSDETIPIINQYNSHSPEPRYNRFPEILRNWRQWRFWERLPVRNMFVLISMITLIVILVSALFVCVRFLMTPFGQFVSVVITGILYFVYVRR